MFTLLVLLIGLTLASASSYSENVNKFPVFPFDQYKFIKVNFKVELRAGGGIRHFDSVIYEVDNGSLFFYETKTMRDGQLETTVEFGNYTENKLEKFKWKIEGNTFSCQNLSQSNPVIHKESQLHRLVYYKNKENLRLEQFVDSQNKEVYRWHEDDGVVKRYFDVQQFKEGLKCTSVFLNFRGETWHAYDLKWEYSNTIPYHLFQIHSKCFE